MPQFIKMIRTRLEKRIPPHLQIFFEDELTKLAQLPQGSPDYLSLRVYLEWLGELPWQNLSKDRLDPVAFFKVLEKFHIGRTRMKEEITEYIAVAALKKSLKGLVFCFVGPPGVGKNNIAYAMAKALGRKIIELRLNELETEESLRGRKLSDQYATPGKIIEGLRKVGTRNPVILLRGIDRPGNRWAVDPVNAILELFDPKQNVAFMDHYLGFAFDLSDILFIVTAKTLEDVPGILKDRLEVFQLNAYTPDEKLRIAKRNLLPKALDNSGLNSAQLKISDATLVFLISNYTREAGVYNLEGLLIRLCRHAAYIVITQRLSEVLVDDRMIINVFGPRQVYSQLRERKTRAGVVTGLVWTSVGGDIIFIEVIVMPGTGRVLVTGQIGDVMRESAEIAVSLVRSDARRFGIDDHLEKKDFHIHVPFGAVQKDGPSAGITILTALYSWFLGRPIDSSIAMTGEITLRGAVLRVGGIKEKVIAAHRAGIKTVIMPKLNEQDLIEVNDEIRSALHFRFVESVQEVLAMAFSLKDSNLKDTALKRLPLH